MKTKIIFYDELIDNDTFEKLRIYLQNPDIKLNNNIDIRKLKSANGDVSPDGYTTYKLLKKRYNDLSENSETSSQENLSQEFDRVGGLIGMFEMVLFCEATDALFEKNYAYLLTCLVLLNQLDVVLYSSIEKHIQQIEESSPAKIMDEATLLKIDEIKRFIMFKRIQKLCQLSIKINGKQTSFKTNLLTSTHVAGRMFLI